MTLERRACAAGEDRRTGTSPLPTARVRCRAPNKASARPAVVLTKAQAHGSWKLAVNMPEGCNAAISQGSTGLPSQCAALAPSRSSRHPERPDAAPSMSSAGEVRMTSMAKSPRSSVDTDPENRPASSTIPSSFSVFRLACSSDSSEKLRPMVSCSRMPKPLHPEQQKGTDRNQAASNDARPALRRGKLISIRQVRRPCGRILPLRARRGPGPVPTSMRALPPHAGRFRSRPAGANAMGVLVIILLDEEAAIASAIKALRALHRQGILTLYSIAALARQGGIGPVLREPVGRYEAPAAPSVGAAVGTLLSVLEGPLHAATKVGVDAAFLEQVSRDLKIGGGAIVAEIDESQLLALESFAIAQGARVFRHRL